MILDSSESMWKFLKASSEFDTIQLHLFAIVIQSINVRWT